MRILNENRKRFTTGVVHCFCGSSSELLELLRLGLYIGITGYSLRTEESCSLVKTIPIDKLLLETDCPHCEIKEQHYGSRFVRTRFEKGKKEGGKNGAVTFDKNSILKDRNEPCTLI